MPIDYAFFDLDRYEQSISDEDKKDFRVRPLFDEDDARHSKAADGDVKSEKSAKSKKKHVHKRLRKQHKKRGSYEVDLLTRFRDTSRLNIDKSSSEAAFDEDNDKFSKSDDSCSLPRSSFSFKDQHSLIEQEGNVPPKTVSTLFLKRYQLKPTDSAKRLKISAKKPELRSSCCPRNMLLVHVGSATRDFGTVEIYVALTVSANAPSAALRAAYTKKHDARWLSRALTLTKLLLRNLSKS